MAIPLLDLVCIGCELRVGTDKGIDGLELRVGIETYSRVVCVVGYGDGTTLDGEDKVAEVDEDARVGGKTGWGEDSIADLGGEEMKGGLKGGDG